VEEGSEEFLKKRKGLSGRYLTASVLTAYSNGLLLIAQCWMLAHIINSLIFEHIDIRDMGLYIGALVLVFVLRFGFLVTSEWAAFLGAQQVKRALRASLQERLRILGPVFVTKQGSGALLNTLTEGIEKIEAYYAQFIPAKMMMTLLPLSVLVVVAPLDWLSGLVLVVTAPLIPIFMILIGKGAEAMNQRQWRKLARMSNHFLDVVQGMTTLKIFNAAQREGEMISKISEEYRRDTMSVLRLAFLSSVMLEFFSTVSIALVAVLIGFRLMWGSMEFFPGLFVLLLAPEFYLPLRKMGAAYHARMEAIGAVDKMIEIMQAAVPALCGKQTVSVGDKGIGVCFKSVGHSYDEGREALGNVNFDIKSGQHVALIGASGAGKSTIFSLLLGFIAPERGQVLVNGHDLSDLDIAVWRSQISWVPQNATLFYGSVLDNIRLGASSAGRADVEHLCSKLGVDAFIRGLPQGYDTHVGEKGYGLSGGQIQRIAIARAFFRDAPLVLMDEPTASLDMETEEVLQRAMGELCCGKTVLTIAHRLHTVRSADEILYMCDGQIAASGTHDQLYTNNAEYARLINSDLPYQEDAA
jgi:ATP-binding cassette subfamily C protein CydD